MTPDQAASVMVLVLALLIVFFAAMHVLDERSRARKAEARRRAAIREWERRADAAPPYYVSDGSTDRPASTSEAL